MKNVLRDKRMVFHGIPRPGSFLVQPMVYASPFHAGAVPPPPDPAEVEAAREAELAKEAPPGEGEEDTPEAAEARAAAKAAREEREAAAAAAGPQAPKPITTPRNLALCVDTLGQNRDFTGAQKDTIRTLSGWLKEALERTEGAFFAKEYLSGGIKERTSAEEETLMAEDKASAEAVIKGEWLPPESLKYCAPPFTLPRCTTPCALLHFSHLPPHPPPHPPPLPPLRAARSWRGGCRGPG